MNFLSELVQANEKGEINYTGWVEWKHISIGYTHCPTCMALDKCWFINNEKPEYPQHFKCHCELLKILKPQPNVNASADCKINKFIDYIFSEKYAWNGKRDLFELLGFNIKDSTFLRDEYEKQALKNYCEGKYKIRKLDEHGQRINIDIKFEKNGRNRVFTSGWMVRPKGKIVNLTPLADKD